MCGICGVVSRFGNQPVSENLLRHMNDTMQHRGPDDAGPTVMPGRAKLKKVQKPKTTVKKPAAVYGGFPA